MTTSCLCNCFLLPMGDQISDRVCDCVRRFIACMCMCRMCACATSTVSLYALHVCVLYVRLGGGSLPSQSSQRVSVMSVRTCVRLHDSR